MFQHFQHHDDNKISSYQQGYNFAPYTSSASRNFPFGSGYGSEGSYQEGNNKMTNHKVFISRVTEDIDADDLRSYFGKYGDVVHVFLPKIFRAFAFVTFADAETAQALCGEDHIIKGASVHVSSAYPMRSHKGAERKGFVQGGGKIGGGYNQGGDWGQQGRGGLGPVGGCKIANGCELMGGNLVMNLFNSAVLAAAQVMLQNQGTWGGMNQGPSHRGSGGNMASRI